MRLAILCQEEPVFLGPFLQGVIRMHPERIAAVFMAGRRSAGEPARTLAQRIESLRILWLIMEPRGFLASLGLRLRSRLLGRRDPRSVEGLARRLGLPVHAVGDPNAPEFQALLKEVAPDAVLNQSERLLRRETLAVPLQGFVNRHASLLPAFRGRMGGFWSHAAEPPRYGLTIHVVDEGVDTGPIILQKEFADVDRAWPYPRVMHHLLAGAPAIFWAAMERLESRGFVPAPQTPKGQPLKFPNLSEARSYRRTLEQRRGGQP
jgi:hypothetical protein